MAHRAYQIAFELGLDVRAMMEIARKAGLKLKSHMSPLEVDQEDQLRSAIDRLSKEVPVADMDEGTVKEAFEKEKVAAKAVAEAAKETAPVEPPVAQPPAPAAGDATGEKKPVRLGEKIQPADDKAKPKTPPTKKKKKIKSQSGARPLDSQEIIEELKGRFIAPAIKDVLGAGRRGPSGRPRPQRMRRGPRSMTRKSRRPAVSSVDPSKEVEIMMPITLKDLSQELGIKANLLIKTLFEQGAMIKINDTLDEEMIELLAAEHGRNVKIRKPKDIEEIVEEATQSDIVEENLVGRDPVIAFLGHVDHGKTSLLDAIRSTNVAAGEAGGITQHMAAYRVRAGDTTLVFLDTPGHEAFTDMRARGAQVTDLVVLVVAADDGVMPQTEEAINHARAAGVPIVVALNKVDKADANPDKALQQLAAKDLLWDQWGGDTVIVRTSAIKGEGIDELLEMISLVAEMQDLKADPKASAQGTVIESQVSEGRGVVATVLVTHGTLHIGDIIVAGKAWGRVRALFDDKGMAITEAGPSTPIVVSGLTGVPNPGDRVVHMSDESTARQVAEERERRDRITMSRAHVTLDNLFDRLAEGQATEVPLILKVDGQGSLVALQEQLEGLSKTEVKVRILHTGVGGINESDILLAHASDAIIIGFHVIAGEKARALAQEKGVDIRLFNVIYQAIDDVRSALEGTLEPEKVEEVKSHVEIRKIFRISRWGNIAGCFVRDGTVERNHRVRLIRNDVVIWDGRLDSLRREKDDVREVREGFECGVKLDGYDDIKEGDIIESFVVNLVPRKLSAVE